MGIFTFSLFLTPFASYRLAVPALFYPLPPLARILYYPLAPRSTRLILYTLYNLYASTAENSTHKGLPERWMCGTGGFSVLLLLACASWNGRTSLTASQGWMRLCLEPRVGAAPNNWIVK